MSVKSSPMVAPVRFSSSSTDFALPPPAERQPSLVASATDDEEMKDVVEDFNVELNDLLTPSKASEMTDGVDSTFDLPMCADGDDEEEESAEEESADEASAEWGLLAKALLVKSADAEEAEAEAESPPRIGRAPMEC